VLGKLIELARRKWVKVAFLTVAGTVGCLVFSLSLQSLLFGGEDADTFRRGMLIAFILPLVICTPLLLLLGLKLSELSSLKQKYAQELAHDSLTACLNGALFSAAVDAYPTLMGSRAGRRTGALLVINIDHLSRLNERIGHSAGDQALRVIAGVIRASVRRGDLVGRIGGDEFGVFLPGATRENAETVAERIRHAVTEVRFETDGSNWPLSVSVGAVLFEAEIDFDDLLRAAGHQVQVAKERGRNRIEYTQLRHGPPPSRPSLH
jgi:diguanylate cyclase